jgi:hypothetical protein
MICKRKYLIPSQTLNVNQNCVYTISVDQIDQEDLPKYDDLEKNDILHAQSSSSRNEEMASFNNTELVNDLPKYNELNLFAQ